MGDPMEDGTDDPVALAAAFEADGYVVLEDFFAPELMAILEARSWQHFGTDPAWAHEENFLTASEVEVVPWFPQREGVADFDAVDDLARLEAVTTAALGRGWRADYCMVMHSRAGSAGQAWHQDCPPEDPARFNLNRLVYTHAVGGDRGGELVVVPGSHRRGEVPAGGPHEPLPDEVVLSPRAGTLVLVHGHCWHRVRAVGPSPRLSINYRAVPVGAPFDLTDVCVYRNMRYRFSTAEVLETR